jgi:hypothetical protein
MDKTKDRKPYISAGQYGFTNNPTLFEAVEQYVADAMADGWSIIPTYGDENVDRAATLNRDNFVMMIINRSAANGKKPGRWRSESHISIWGPDGLSIPPPRIYDWDTIVAAQTKCSVCGSSGVETKRYGFAGRCCEACLPRMQAKHEYLGWDS